MKVLITRLLCLVLLSGLMGGCKVYQSLGKSVGGFLHPVSGDKFVHISNDEWDSENSALIYFYRPHSDWAGDEIESPSVYIDDKHYFNLRNDAYTWLEVYPGTRQINMRRPLLGLEGMGHFALKMIADFEVDVRPGKIYYFRYSEVKPPKEVNPDLDPESELGKGDLQLVTRDYAMTEIVKTRFLNSDMLAPNHAAVSITETNRVTDYERRVDELELAREEEVAQLRLDGHYREAKWYWPFGGGPTKRLQTDLEMEKLEREHEAYLASLEEPEPADASPAWWAFWESKAEGDIAE